MIAAAGPLLADLGTVGVAAVAFVVGALTAVFNVVAGGGSLLTIPLLVEMGLSPQVANATNRIGVVTQTVTSSATFAAQGRMPWRYAAPLIPASLVGSAIGAWTASALDADTFRIAIAVLFAAMGVWLVLDQLGWTPGAGDDADEPRRVDDERPKPWVVLAFVGVGFYGGFIQAGVGIAIVLVLHVAARVELVSANAVKALQVVAFGAISLALFASRGQVDWAAGLWLALGGMTGGWWGARYATRVDPTWLKRALIVAVWIAAVRFATAG